MSKFIKTATAAIATAFAGRAIAAEAAKLAPVGATWFAWFTDMAGPISIMAGAVYAVLLVVHKLYQMQREWRNDRKQQGN